MTVDCRHVNVFGWRVDRTGRFSPPQRSDEAAGCEIDGRGKAPMLSVQVGTQPSHYQRGGQTTISTRNDGAPHGADGPLPGFDMWNRNATNAQ
jgi:hypothetical protein